MSRLLGFLLSVIKAFFSAVVQLAWAMATFFLLAGLIGYFKVDASSITTLLSLVQFIMERWGFFFFVIFAWEFFMNFKEWMKPVLRQEDLDVKTKKKKEEKL